MGLAKCQTVNSVQTFSAPEHYDFNKNVRIRIGQKYDNNRILPIFRANPKQTTPKKENAFFNDFERNAVFYNGRLNKTTYLYIGRYR